MRVAIIQSEIIWEKPIENRENFESQIESLPENPDLVILPEMFTSGFTMTPSNVAEELSGDTVEWMCSIASRTESAICGTVVIADKGSFYNRFLFVYPTGEIRYYDKRHLFTLSGENKVYMPGKEKTIIEFKGFRICPMICYDLRFPVFSRNVENFDLLIYSANWPSPRINAWDTLLKARAVENMCFVAGVNRIGEDFNHHKYPGHSQVVDYLGNYLIGPAKGKQQLSVFLDREEMLQTRNKLGFLNDMDNFTVN